MGSLWEPAQQKYCGDDPDAFPLGLACFYDKTNTDVFGSLSCAPFICTPTFLNIDCRNDESNYMVLGYVPNLGYEKGTAQSQTSLMKLQDEHNCLSLITNQIKKNHDEGGFRTEVMGRRVCVFVFTLLQVTHWVTAPLWDILMGDFQNLSIVIANVCLKNFPVPYPRVLLSHW
jgi:hypothetical protein